MNTETLLQQLWNTPGSTAALSLTAVRVHGLDAQEFLQGQLTLDLRKLTADTHRLTAWCNAKGRVWCVLRIWREDDGFMLLLANNQLEAFLKRMRMFVLRAKVSLETLDQRCYGWIGNTASGKEITRDAQGVHLRFDEHHGLEMSTSDKPVAPDTNPEQISTAWLALRLLAQEPQIDASSQEQFLPQSIGLEALDGLHFNKGCFVGQEIVARVHYKGRAPQQLRCLLLEADETLPDGPVQLAQATLGSTRVVQLVEHIKAASAPSA